MPVSLANILKNRIGVYLRLYVVVIKKFIISVKSILLRIVYSDCSKISELIDVVKGIFLFDRGYNDYKQIYHIP